jgi:group I intron endonuclease
MALLPESIVPADRFGIIYLITHRESGKQYVGQTVRRLNRRWSSHKQKDPRKTSVMTLAIAKYGADAFDVEHLDWACSQEMLDHKERFWIGFLDTVSPNGYNLKDGGNGGGRPHPESIARMAETKRGRKLPSTHPFCGKGRKPWTHNRPLTAEQQARSIAGLKKRYAEGMIHPMQGKHHSAKSRALISKNTQKIRLHRRRAIVCQETGVVFDGAVTAAKWLAGRTGSSLKTIRSALCQALRRNRSSYGFHWAYVEPTVTKEVLCP